MEKPKTFADLYKEGCKLLKEEPDNLSTYTELDSLMTFIENHPEKEQIKFALSSKRVCIVIPYEMFPEKRLPHDDIIKETGQQVVFACPTYDRYISLLIDQMKD